jgi:cardiolipin synthase
MFLQSVPWTEIFLFLMKSFYWITLVGVVMVVILDNRNPLKTISWVLILILLPYVGLFLYIFLGQRYRKVKIISKKSIRSIENNPAYLYEELDPASYPPECTGLIRMLRENNSHPVFSGNAVRLITNGREKFDLLFQDIRSAKKHIHLEYYILDSCKIGYELQTLLIQKAQEGVEVRVIYDDLGSWHTKKAYFKELQDGGVQVYPFLKVRLPWLSPKTNYRNHRKIVVIDGEIGYTGGFNVADRYLDGGTFPYWRDTQVRIEGKGVYGLQTAFLIDWYFISRDLITSKFYFPDLANKGNCLVQTATSSTDTDWGNIMQGIFKILTTAKRYVYLQTPYFLPNESLLSAMQTAALSGVDVRLMVPADSDTKVALKGMHSYFTEILEAGVKVYVYHKGFMHAKTVVSDDIVSTVGSTNLDYRSFELDFEVNAFVYDRTFAKEMKAAFEQDEADSTQILLSEWADRPRIKRYIESICRVFGPQL